MSSTPQAPPRDPHVLPPLLPPESFLRPGPPPPRRRSRPWLVPLLFAATFLTLAFAGQDSGTAGELGLLHWRSFVSGLPYALAVVAILGSHEMGHYLACRRYGIPATLPFFLPGVPPFGTFGAVIRIRGRIPDRRALFDVAIAGPLAGFVVALPIYAWGYATAERFDMESLSSMPPGSGLYLFGEPPLGRLLAAWIDPPAPTEMNALMLAAWLGMLVTALNLFPVGQLDGGHLAYAISRRLHRTLSRATIAGLALLIAWQAIVVRTFPAYVLWFGILLWMRDRHPPLYDEATPLGRGRVWLAVLAGVLFLLTFTAVPLRIAGF